MSLCYLLQGDLAGQYVWVASEYAAQGVSDGWAWDTTNQPYPFNVPPLVADPFAPVPDSLQAWIDAGSPPRDPPAPPNNAPTDIILTPSTVAADAAIGTVVGMLTATDPDETGTPTFVLTSDAGGKFELASTSVKVKAALTEGTETIGAKVTDSGGATFSKNLTITVTAAVVPEEV